VTRDRRLAADSQHLAPMLIQSNEPLEQLREVLTHFDLPLPRDLFSRCMLCNVVLVNDEATGDRRCPKCGRVYWEGLHTRRMRDALARTFGQTG
jgi:hypothetical protein